MGIKVEALGGKGPRAHDMDPWECIIGIREYDIPYYLRVAIDIDIRVSLWYVVTFTAGQPTFHHIAERVKCADPVIMAYDIKTTMLHLQMR